MNIKQLKPHLLILGLATLLTVILTWPLLPNISSYYTDWGDYPLHGSIFWWNADSIKTGRIFHQKEYFQGYQFYPHPFSLTFTNNSVFPSFVFAPIYWITGSLPFSFNLYIFLTFVFSFLAAFYAINVILRAKPEGSLANAGTETMDSLRSPHGSGILRSAQNDKGVFLASLVGAFIFAFNPQTFTRLPQHPDILGRYFLPLVFLFAYKLFDKPKLTTSLLLWLVLTLNSLTTNYFQIFAWIFLPVLALPFLAAAVWGKDWSYLARLGRSALIGIIFIPLLLYFNLPFWQFSQQEGVGRTVDEAKFFSARINDWFAPAQDNLIYGGWSKFLHQFREPKDDRGVLNYEEHTLFIGILATTLFLLGIKPFLKSKLNKAYFLILLLGSFVLLWGPFLPPFILLHKLIPLMQGIRAPTRFEYVFLVPFSLIASFGALWLIRGRRIWVIGVIGVILILENLTPKDFSSRSQIIQNQNLQKFSFLKDKVTLHLPIYGLEDADVFGKNSLYLNWATQTHEKIMNGNSGYLPPDQMALLNLLKVDGESMKRLKALKVDYILIHKDISADIEIVDLSQKDNPPICDFEKDFNLRAVDEDLIVENRSECFLPGIYHDRYRKVEVAGQVWEFRLPILIGPNEQIILTSEDREVRRK